VRFSFREFPALGGGDLTPRPVVDVWLAGLDRTPLACLVDTGTLRTRMAYELAETAEVDLSEGLTEQFFVAGHLISGTSARVSLSLQAEGKTHDWDAPVWFCEPWPFSFQLLGLDGFLRYFRITLSAYEEWLECIPESPS
jgi:hypothetical protein